MKIEGFKALIKRKVKESENIFFQKKLDEIVKHYEGCKSAIDEMGMYNDIFKKQYGQAINHLLFLRDIAATAVKDNYKEKEE